MRDDREPDPGDPQKHSFEDALDDIFGASPEDEPGEARSEPPASATPEPPRPAPPPPAYQPIDAYPTPQTASPAPRPQRSLGRMIGIGCVVIFAIGFVCAAILLIVSLLTADPSGVAMAVVDVAAYHEDSLTPFLS